MARKKGNQQKKPVPSTGSELPAKCERANASEIKVLHEEQLLRNHSDVNSKEGIDNKRHVQAETKGKQQSRKFPRRTEEVVNRKQVEEKPETDAGDCNTTVSAAESLHSMGKDDVPSNTCHSTKNSESSFAYSLNGMHNGDDTMEKVEFSYILILKCLRSLVLSTLKASTEWMERHRPLLITMRASILKACHYVQVKIEQAFPVVLKWIMHFVNIMLLLFMVWLDCTLRGIDSFLRMGTTSFFSVLWCSVLSVTAMVGIFKFLIVLAVAAIAGLLVGLTIAVLLMAISGIVLLWFYGSFWTTMLVLLSGGLAFILGRERLALFIATSYSVYCAWASVGWLGLLFGLNISFISSDVLIFFLRNNINEQRRATGAAEQTAEVPGQSGFVSDDQVRNSSAEAGAAGPSTDRRSGVPSTSGLDSETTSEDEVVRLLNCSDHYAALGLSRFENVDVSVLKREYRKKAMLVHPDKNMGNEKAAEAFKKLQNAYEVLLDSFKRKAYDDELRREELLHYFRQFQEASQKSRRRGFFSRSFAHGETDEEDTLKESRRIACRKCGNFHVWIHTKKVKSRARWCQECKDFHQAKDGDGWVEQSSHPLLFGMLQKVEPPVAYVCADSKIYDATEWYICQGMRCPANSHKPSFHVNTSMTSKQSTGRGASSGQRGGIPTPNMEEAMTEDEFFEWLQNAVQSGMFDSFPGGPSESPSAQSGNTSKSSGGNNSSNSAKRKKKGRK
ncbi:uncharacterized protein LOC113765005 [Coffea eugenioides]|uniref:uncharacterized protein LOC113765005 n=1 Tax=Coffea eugenioides TaxID=49369 RepID=UPI000F609707|nr:uncharacterized protein LOC113765005 [Coffea eugenioides]XP_027164858.1 uncharacterized protein LOC113765005 [Coffea eugenioides]